MRERRVNDSMKHLEALDALMLECAHRQMTQDAKGRWKAKSCDTAQSMALTYYMNLRENLRVFAEEPNVLQIYTISCTALHPVVHAAEFFTPAADSSIEFFF